MKLKQAKEIAEEFISQVKDLCEKVEIFEGIRRDYKNIRNISLIILPRRLNAFLRVLMEGHINNKWQLTNKIDIIYLIFKKIRIEIHISDQED